MSPTPGLTPPRGYTLLFLQNPCGLGEAKKTLPWRKFVQELNYLCQKSKLPQRRDGEGENAHDITEEAGSIRLVKIIQERLEDIARFPLCPEKFCRQNLNFSKSKRMPGAETAELTIAVSLSQGAAHGCLPQRRADEMGAKPNLLHSLAQGHGRD